MVALAEFLLLAWLGRLLLCILSVGRDVPKWNFSASRKFASKDVYDLFPQQMEDGSKVPRRGFGSLMTHNATHSFCRMLVMRAKDKGKSILVENWWQSWL